MVITLLKLTCFRFWSFRLIFSGSEEVSRRWERGAVISGYRRRLSKPLLTVSSLDLHDFQVSCKWRSWAVICFTERGFCSRFRRLFSSIINSLSFLIFWVFTCIKLLYFSSSVRNTKVTQSSDVCELPFLIQCKFTFLRLPFKHLHAFYLLFNIPFILQSYLI